MATVLIVDDERDLRDGLSEAVRDLEHEVLVAASGREALTIAATNRPDAVLSTTIAGSRRIYAGCGSTRSASFSSTPICCRFSTPYRHDGATGLSVLR